MKILSEKTGKLVKAENFLISSHSQNISGLQNTDGQSKYKINEKIILPLLFRVRQVIRIRKGKAFFDSIGIY